MKKLYALVATLIFFGLVTLTAYGVWYVSPVAFGTLITMGVIGFLPGKTRAQLWCLNVWVSLDQLWQVVWAPVLNLLLQPMGAHMFGAPDETASSVVGKNAYRNKPFIWIDKVLSFFDPSKGSHGKASIETSESIDWSKK